MVATTKKHYLLIHFWPTEGGFRKRIEMLSNVLRTKGHVERIDIQQFVSQHLPAPAAEPKTKSQPDNDTHLHKPAGSVYRHVKIAAAKIAGISYGAR